MPAQALLSHSAKSMVPTVSGCTRVYCQTLLYADAVERAGTFDPVQVIKALEDHEFSGMGNGESIYRGADHQVFKNVLVVRGLRTLQASLTYLRSLTLLTETKLPTHRISTLAS